MAATLRRRSASASSITPLSEDNRPPSNAAVTSPGRQNGHAVVKPAISAIVTTESDFAYIPLPALIGQPLVGGKIICPFHHDRRPSLHVYQDHFHCFVCGARGDHIDWLMFTENMTRAEALRLLAAWDGPTCTPEADDDGRTLAQALAIWEASQPIAKAATALHYLCEVRRIDVDALPDDAALRFHPKCPIVRRGGTLPCIVALYRDVLSDDFAGVHLVLLTDDVLFAGGKVRRLTLGRWPAPRAIKLWPAHDEHLFLGEGLETVLAAGTRLDYHNAPMLPAWAAGSGINMANFPVLPGISKLVLLVDHDINGNGERYANDARRTWRTAGREVERLLAPEVGTDFNDFVIAQQASAS